MGTDQLFGVDLLEARRYICLGLLDTGPKNLKYMKIVNVLTAGQDYPGIKIDLSLGCKE